MMEITSQINFHIPYLNIVSFSTSSRADISRRTYDHDQPKKFPPLLKRIYSYKNGVAPEVADIRVWRAAMFWQCLKMTFIDHRKGKDQYLLQPLLNLPFQPATQFQLSVDGGVQIKMLIMHTSVHVVWTRRSIPRKACSKEKNPTNFRVHGAFWVFNFDRWITGK